MPSAQPFHWYSWVAFVPISKLWIWIFQFTKRPLERWLQSLLTTLRRNTCGPSPLPLLTRLSSWAHRLDLEHLIHCLGLCLGPQRACRSWWWSACQSQACVRYLSQSPPSWLFLKKDFISCARLLIKTAILMPEAQDGEVTIVEVESLGYNKAKVIGMIYFYHKKAKVVKMIWLTFSATHSGKASLSGHERRRRSAEVRWCSSSLCPCHHQDCAGEPMML